ncbi:hypothetical protein CBM2633_P380019 [Cupriavidus taiwanensis]|uniref:Uncharacterized protein n=1 Tax=Cupriavidus neocaledonicus TaxID=1040979 RepID=A0A375HWZ8_9BURK|nr:hypothetical protein CBM2585_P380019 [Cupriavidus taiwanensis]SOZ40700.1 hypothetical protein CBM2605_P380021 [Cupriavidus neocaledonicus]SOY76620.1 hypothetical protein CBM2588_P420021 [Cupriavidus taiwanensis]SOZ02506.1 hypothetical protein CBM2600_P410021 [Cupriavidus taiwanensis]SOZ07057.1 hypothetical protein CBM2599_P380019 [Cupriavidus taiwanensis]
MSAMASDLRASASVRWVSGDERPAVIQATVGDIPISVETDRFETISMRFPWRLI